MSKNNQNQNWEVYFLIPVIVMFVVSRQVPAIDHAHAVAAAQFRLAVDLICLVGYVVALSIRLAQKKKSAVGIDGLYGINPNDIVMAMEYWSVRADFGRSFLYFFKNSWYALLFVAGLPIIAFVGGLVTLANGGTLRSAMPAFILVLAFVAVVYLAFTGIGARRYPSPTLPVRCWVALTRQGFTDIKPDVTSVVLWKNVRSVRRNGDDVYLFTQSDSYYFPNVLAGGSDKGRLFQECATALRSGAPLPAGQLPMESPYPQQQPMPTPNPYPAPASVWPPPPTDPVYRSVDTS